MNSTNFIRVSSPNPAKGVRRSGHIGAGREHSAGNPKDEYVQSSGDDQQSFFQRASLLKRSAQAVVGKACGVLAGGGIVATVFPVIEFLGPVTGIPMAIAGTVMAGKGAHAYLTSESDEQKKEALKNIGKGCALFAAGAAATALGILLDPAMIDEATVGIAAVAGAASGGVAGGAFGFFSEDNAVAGREKPPESVARTR